MTQHQKQVEHDLLIHLMEQYLGRETMEVTEELLDVCGSSIDTRALPLLHRRLQEEEAQLTILEARGYIRMREKCEQLIASLCPLITILEQSEPESRRDNA